MTAFMTSFVYGSADANVIVLERSVASAESRPISDLETTTILPRFAESPWNSAAPAAADTKKWEQIRVSARGKLTCEDS